MPILEPVEPVKLRCVEIDPRHLSLAELEAGDCRYPYGGDEEGEAITFCGHPRREDSSYCAAHFHLTRNPRRRRKPPLARPRGGRGGRMTFEEGDRDPADAATPPSRGKRISLLNFKLQHRE